MLLSQKSLGVEIRPSGVAFALLGGSVATPLLERVAYAPLAPGSLRVSLREANILDPAAFCETVRSAHNLLLYNGTRVSVTLPDAVGRIMMLDVEGRFKSRAEGLDIIRWKLKKNIPFDIADTHLDYQQLSVRENGDMALMVALVSRDVISQYEEQLMIAGLTPARIDFNSFNLYRAFENRLAPQDDVALISFYDNALGIMVFDGGVLEFQRVKDLPGSNGVDSRVFMEINSSLKVYRDRFPERTVQHVSCIAPPAVARDFCCMVAEATGFEPSLLELKSVVRPSDSAPADQESLYPFTTAVGAALRSL
ncbi:MAG: pilus assembly protein PilM [Desulfuromonadales bacterium]|nr:pilus assembly protein PilM [Desulfuromonadales bacterium]